MRNTINFIVHMKDHPSESQSNYLPSNLSTSTKHLPLGSEAMIIYLLTID